MTVLTIVAVGILGTCVLPVRAQGKKGASKADEKDYEDVTLVTRGPVPILLRCTYYPGPETKQTVPLILVHAWNSNRSRLHRLASFLQSRDHSVIVPDLRGHGRSLNIQGGNQPIDRDKMKRDAVASMVWDVEAAKTFLLKKHNEGLLNIELLGVLGTEFGATIALNWASMDWNTQNLPTYKMGQDVKALILVSPETSYKGVTSKISLQNPKIQRMVSVALVVGRSSRQYTDTRRIHSGLKKFHDEAELSLIKYERPSSRSGITLVEESQNVPAFIAKFFDERLRKKADVFPAWVDRTSPLE